MLVVAVNKQSRCSRFILEPQEAVQYPTNGKRSQVIQMEFRLVGTVDKAVLLEVVNRWRKNICHQQGVCGEQLRQLAAGRYQNLVGDRSSITQVTIQKVCY